MKDAKGLGRTDRWLENGHGDVRCGMENMINNIAIAACGARRVLDMLGKTLCKLCEC